MNHDNIPVNQLAALYSGLLESLSEGFNIEKIAEQVVNSIDSDDLAENVVMNIDMKDLAANVMDYLSIVELADAVYQNLDMDELAKEVTNNIPYSDIAETVVDYLDSNQLESMLDLQSKIEDYSYFLSVDEIDRRLESLLASFNYQTPCNIGQYFIEASKKVYEELSAELTQSVKEMIDLVNDMRANQIEETSVDVIETVAEESPVQSNEEFNGIFNPELMGIITISHYIMNNLDNPNIANFEPMTLWSHYMNAKTSYIESVKENNEK